MKRKLLKIALAIGGAILTLGVILAGTQGLMWVITPQQLSTIESALGSTWLPMTLIKWSVLCVLIIQWNRLVPCLIRRMGYSSVSLSRIMTIRWHLTIMVAALEVILLISKLSAGF
jgi:hypothetical protein